MLMNGEVLVTCEKVRVSYTRGKVQLGLRWSADAERDLVPVKIDRSTIKLMPRKKAEKYLQEREK